MIALFYRMLNEQQRIILPALLSLAFIHMFFLYKKDRAIPKIMLQSNFAFSVGCLLLTVIESIKQLGYKQKIENSIYPFILFDFSMLIFFIGSVLVIRGCFLHPKYSNKKVGLYMWIVLLALFTILYIISRFIDF